MTTGRINQVTTLRTTRPAQGRATPARRDARPRNAPSTSKVRLACFQTEKTFSAPHTRQPSTKHPNTTHGGLLSLSHSSGALYFTTALPGMPFYQAVPATLEGRPLTTPEGFYATRPQRQRASLLRPHSHKGNRVIQDRLFFLLSKTIPSKIGNTAAVSNTASGPLCRRLTDDAEGQLGTITTQLLLRTDDPNQYDTHQLNLVRSNTDTTAGIRTNPPHLSLPPAVDGNKPASYVNRDTRPPAARRRTQCTTPNLGRDALVAKSVHPALSDATRAAPPATPTTLQWLFRSPAEASHFIPC